MTMKRLSLPASVIHDWPSFHATCAQHLHFPGYYGENMDAWNDCIGEHIESCDMLVLQIEDSERFRQTCPDQWNALLDCVSFINTERYANTQPVIETGKVAIVLL